MATRAEFDAMFAHLASGRLRPVVDRVYRLDDAAAAFARLDAPDLFGKVVVRVRAHPSG
jgi:NADPH:quinone reductase